MDVETLLQWLNRCPGGCGVFISEPDGTYPMPCADLAWERGCEEALLMAKFPGTYPNEIQAGKLRLQLRRVPRGTPIRLAHASMESTAALEDIRLLKRNKAWSEPVAEPALAARITLLPAYS